MAAPGAAATCIFLTLLSFLSLALGSAVVGFNWGTSSSQLLPPSKVVELLRSNGVTKVKLLDASHQVMESLSGSRIDVMVGIPNAMLQHLNSSRKASESWVHDNITRHISNGGSSGVRIRSVAVGEDPFLQIHGKQFEPYVIGAATNIQLALSAAKLEDEVKVVVPCSSDVYQSNSSLPSKGHFRPEFNKTMTQLLSFLHKHVSPFVVNLNPFLSFRQSKNLTIDYFLFQATNDKLVDGQNTYKNSFDASIDGLIAALSKAGFSNMEVNVGQIGWPTDGATGASSSVAQAFMKGLISHLLSNRGTPLRPKQQTIETYIFSLLDEDQRSIDSGSFERHMGIFTFDGQAKFRVNLGRGSGNLVNAQNVKYLASKWCVVNNNKDMSNASASAVEACGVADCTAQSPGGSCYNIGWPSNISYAFNSYYQLHEQRTNSCDFGGLGLITTVDPSFGECRFAVGLPMSPSPSLQGTFFGWRTLLIALFLVCMCICWF